MAWETEVDGYRAKKRLNYKKIIVTLLILIALLISIGLGVKFGVEFAIKSYIESSSADEPEVVIPDDITINLVAIGDVMCHNANFNSAYIRETNTYDFTPVFANVAKYITKADIAIRKFGNYFCR